jgi:hypothetical protein
MPVARALVRPTILSVSPDAGLLFARTQILKNAGYDVIAAMNRHVAIVAAANHALDLALLCNAFREEEAESIEHDLFVVCPQLAVLQLGELLRSAGSGQDLSPEQLLLAVRASLTTHNARRS